MVRVAIWLMAVWLALPVWAEGNLTLTILAEPSAHRPVVGEMINVTIRAVYDRKIANEKLEIDPTDAFDWIQTRPDDWREERIDGLPWIVMERHLALWPKRSGPLQFGPVRHHLTIIDQRSQRQDVVVQAKPLTVSVGEFPALRGWHLAAADLQLTDELSTDAAHLADGEQVVRTVRLRAKGALPEHLPPRPVVSENWLITFAAPVERTLTLTAEGPVAEAVWTWQFRPHTGEPGMLEPVKIPYFNTVNHQIETVEIPPLFIGYASFYTGQVPRGRIEAGQVWLLVGAMMAGLIGGLLLAVTRYAPQTTRQAMRRFRARWSPWSWWAMWRARQRGDLLALRRLAEEVGASRERRDRLDRAIYGRPSK
ncbi:BatD family protein [Paracoccus caeni]|uniref:BatD family protein n=1 Tax=Paracoccus caeni TaxID=657651 RepID=A0A934W0K8_9RHOB|nr:BatD family protein [Paracoccus caeni]MBK4218192.1 BatD family protein [Paracoccus caeni]